MSQTVQSNPRALVESVARTLPPSARDDFRNLLNEIVLANLTALSPGGNLIQPGGTQANSSAAPVGVTHSVAAANGVATVTISNPAQHVTPIWHEISYGPLASFTKNPTTLEPTTATSVTIPQSGVNAYYRLRSSFDKKTWSPYTLASTNSINAGLVESSAISSAATFNQSNFAVVASQSYGADAAVTISGTGGILSSYTAVKGSKESLRPSATIFGVEFGLTQYVGYDGSQFHIKGTLAEVLDDSLEPVGAVAVGGGQTGGGGTSGGNGGRMSAVSPQ